MNTSRAFPGTSVATFLFAFAFALSGSAFAVAPDAGEMLAAKTWAARTFPDTNQVTPMPRLKIVYQDVADGVTRSRSWRGTPYQLGDKTYTHGIAFNSVKHILVTLDKPARHFSAEVGLENNDDTQRGADLGYGSVTFQVLVASNEVFKTPVMRLKDGAKPVEVDLHGAKEFEIRVGDGGDGRSWDQALWANAVVTLEDGTQLRLQDLPWDEAASAPYAISFRYNGTNSAELFARWPHTVREEKLDAQRTMRETTWRDPATGLQVQIEAVQFGDFPAVEWVARFTNTSKTNTPILEDIEALDGPLPVPASGGPTLNWNIGGVASFDDFAPQRKKMEPNTKFHLQPGGGGRSSSLVMPFFNLEGADAGVIAAVGWSGEWAADFSSSPQGQVALKTGLAKTHLKLLPGESIRTPRMCLMFYQGDVVRGQNLWRQFVLAHHRPNISGKPLVAGITCGNWGGTRAEVHLDNIQKIEDHKLPLAYYWIDADWFGPANWPVSTGSWEVKKDLYPNSFKPLSDALRKSNRELMLWFEPERVFKGTTWQKAHPEWLLGTGDNYLLNIGNPDARKFLTDFISDRIDEFGLGCYRQDFNIDPLGLWQAADAPDRQGATELHYIEGLYAFWDELLARHPGLMIDNCASGGRRLDLETLGRATPYWRTDGPRDAIAHQCHTYGLLNWVPLNATSVDRVEDDYDFRSGMSSGLCLNWWITGDAPAERIRADFPFDWARETLEQYLKFREFYYGDYYPLTTYSQSRDVWMAYQLNQTDGARGIVVALRRPDSPYQTARFPLRGIDAGARYRVTNLDTKAQVTASGKDLAKTGVEVELKGKPGSALMLYEKQ